MEQTLQALTGILLKAIPTIVLVMVLVAYFKAVLFRPLERVLKQREDLIEGSRRLAQESLDAAERKQQDYEARFRDARGEVYRAQEETRRTWLANQAAEMAEARRRSEVSLRDAKQHIAAEAAGAREGLSEASAALADQIATMILARRAG